MEVSVEVTAALGAGVFQLATPGSDDSTLVQVEGEKVYSVVSGPTASLRTLVLDFERVEVPAGVFEGCWRVRTSIRCLPGLGPATVWYAPGIGRVKSELDGLDGPVQEELTAFRPLGAFTRGDSNRDRKVDLCDAVYLLRHLFLAGPAPAPPFPECRQSDVSELV